MDTPQPANRYAGSTFAGGRPPFTALPNWLAGRATAFEIAVLWSLQHHYPNICPSLNRIAMMSGLSRRTVMGVLNTLERRGWIIREHRQDQRGDSAPNHYVLTIWGEPPSEGVGQEMPHPGQEMPGGRAADALGVGQEMPPNKNKNNKNNSRREESPYPLRKGETLAVVGDPVTVIGSDACIRPTPPPASGGTLAAVPQPEPAPSPPKRTRMAKPQPFTPTPDDIPASLLPVEAPLMAFWAEKGGQRTKAAWTALLGNLERIWRDPAGGTDVIRQQLDNAIQSGWTSVTYANWQKWGRPAPFPPVAGMASGRRKSATESAADAAKAFYNALETA